MKLRWVLRYSPPERLLRIARIVGTVGQVGGGGYSYKLSLGFALSPIWYRVRFRRELYGWILTVFGLRIHWRKSYGGICV